MERYSARISDPYIMALVTYALAKVSFLSLSASELTNSPPQSRSAEADQALDRLKLMARDEGGFVYWSPSKIERNKVRYEFNRPFLEPKDRQLNDALAVEATGYALLSLFQLEGGGITILQDEIVKWLNTMRQGVGGFVSTVDTIIAMEALVKYSYHNNIKDLTKMVVTVDLPDSNITQHFPIDREGVSRDRSIDIPNVYGTINLFAAGRGQALAQLDLTWGVDVEARRDRAPKECFELKIKEFYHGRNKSEIVTKVGGRK